MSALGLVVLLAAPVEGRPVPREGAPAPGAGPEAGAARAAADPGAPGWLPFGPGLGRGGAFGVPDAALTPAGVSQGPGGAPVTGPGRSSTRAAAPGPPAARESGPPDRPAAADSAVGPGATTLEAIRARVAAYHRDPRRLDEAREVLERLLRTERPVAALILLARVCLLWGDVRGTTDAERLAAYGRGREVGQRAVELAPRTPEARFWHAANGVRLVEVRGALRALWLARSLRAEIAALLDLAPRYAPAYGLAGRLELALPWGDLAEAEIRLRRGLQLDPHHTGRRVELARVLARRGRPDEARREMGRVLAERAPTSVADWTALDRPRARELLEALGPGPGRR